VLIELHNSREVLTMYLVCTGMNEFDRQKAAIASLNVNMGSFVHNRESAGAG
jgi:hypothetical protein